MTLREQTITNRKAQHQNQLPLSDNLMSLIFLVPSNLNEQQRLCSLNEHSSDSNASIYISPSETAFSWTFLRFQNRRCRPKYHRNRSSFYIIDEGETGEGGQGFWVIDEETGEEGFTGLSTETELWVLGAKGSYSKRRLYGRSFKKGKPKGYGKEDKRSRPGFRPNSKGKGYAACDSDQQDTAFWGKGKGKKGKKGMKGKILSKECLHGKQKVKEMARIKEESSFNNLHKQASLNKPLLVPHKPPKNQKLPRPRKAGVMIMIPIGQMTGQHGNPITDMMEILPRWLVQLLLLGNWPLQRTSVQNIFKTFLCTDRRTKTTGSVFLLFACSDISGTNSCPSWLTCFCLCPCCTSASKIWAGNHFRASGSLKRASQTDSGDKHPNEQHTCPFDSDITEECCISELWSWCPASTPVWVRGSWFSSDWCDSWLRLYQSHGFPLCDRSSCSSLPTTSKAWPHLVFQTTMFK